MDMIDNKQYEVLAWGATACIAIFILIVVSIVARYEMRNMNQEKLRDRNTVKEMLIKICVAQYQQGKLKDVNDCTNWLQSQSDELGNKGHTVLTPTDYYDIAVKARQRYESRK